MSSAYKTDLDKLYNDKKVYNIDRVLANYINDETSFNSALPLVDYFVGVSAITFAYQLNVDVDRYLRQVGGLPVSNAPKTFLATNGNAVLSMAAPASCPGSPSAPGAPPAAPADVIRAATFNGDPDTNDIIINVLENKTEAMVISTKNVLLNNLTKNIQTIAKSLLGGTAYSSANFTNRLQTASHEDFNLYLSEINSTISYSYFDAARIILPDAETDVSSVTDATEKANIKEADRIRISAVRGFKSLYGNKYLLLRGALRDVSRKALEHITMELPMDKSQEFLSAFANRANMEARAAHPEHYLLLRTTMVDLLEISSDMYYSSDPKIMMFMRKMLVDLYIKTCYPLIHFDYMDILLKKYTAMGDFVNARVALLAKVLFTYNVVNTLVGSISDVPPEISTDLTTNLYNYIRRNNRGDIQATGNREDRIKDIVLELHDMSNKVVSTSYMNELLSKAIQGNQLTLRSLNANHVVSSGKTGKQTVIFWVLFSFLLLEIVAISVLLYLEMYNGAALLAGLYITAILLMKIIQWIMSALRKN